MGLLSQCDVCCAFCSEFAALCGLFGVPAQKAPAEANVVAQNLIVAQSAEPANDEDGETEAGDTYLLAAIKVLKILFGGII